MLPWCSLAISRVTAPAVAGRDSCMRSTHLLLSGSKLVRQHPHRCCGRCRRCRLLLLHISMPLLQLQLVLLLERRRLLLQLRPRCKARGRQALLTLLLSCCKLRACGGSTV